MSRDKPIKTLRARAIHIVDETGACKIELRAGPGSFSHINFVREGPRREWRGGLELLGNLPNGVVFWKDLQRHGFCIVGHEDGASVAFFGSDFQYGFQCTIRDHEGWRYVMFESQSSQQFLPPDPFAGDRE